MVSRLTLAIVRTMGSKRGRSSNSSDDEDDLGCDVSLWSLLQMGSSHTCAKVG